MVSRKKTNVIPTVEHAVEQPPEQPLIPNDAPIPPVPSDSTLRRSTSGVERESERYSKGGAKSGAGKGGSGKSFKGSSSEETSASKPMKRKKKMKGYELKGMGIREPSRYKPNKKKTAKKGTHKIVRRK
jgi:hypothetical protein